MIRIVILSVVAAVALVVGTELGGSKAEAHPGGWYGHSVHYPYYGRSVVLVPGPLTIAPRFAVYYRPAPGLPWQINGFFVSRYQADVQASLLANQGFQALVALR